MQTAKLKNWSIVGSGAEGVYLMGRVFDHPDKRRCPDGSIVTTSPVQMLDMKEGTAFTLNTQYTLEK